MILKPVHKGLFRNHNVHVTFIYHPPNDLLITKRGEGTFTRRYVANILTKISRQGFTNIGTNRLKYVLRDATRCTEHHPRLILICLLKKCLI